MIQFRGMAPARFAGQEMPSATTAVAGNLERQLTGAGLLHGTVEAVRVMAQNAIKAALLVKLGKNDDQAKIVAQLGGTTQNVHCEGLKEDTSYTSPLKFQNHLVIFEAVDEQPVRAAG